MERDDLIKDFTHDIIKSRCWDAQEVKGRSILAHGIPVEVPNYPLYPRTKEEMRLLNQAKIRRRVEMAIGALYRRKCEKTYKKASSSVFIADNSSHMPLIIFNLAKLSSLIYWDTFSTMCKEQSLPSNGDFISAHSLH